MFGSGNFGDKSPLIFENFEISKFSKMYSGNLSQIALSTNTHRDVITRANTPSHVITSTNTLS